MSRGQREKELERSRAFPRGVSGNEAGTLRRPKAFADPVKGMGERVLQPQLDSPLQGTARSPMLLSLAAPPNLSPPQLLAPLPLQQVLEGRRACALLRPCPAFHVSLPSLFLHGSSSTATIGQPTSSLRPINAGLSPPCYWVEQNKNRARRGRDAPRQRQRLRSGRQVSVPGTGQRTRDLSEQQQRRQRPEGSVPARLARLGGRRPLPSPGLPSDAAARWEGEGAWRPWPGLVGSGSAGPGSGRLRRAPPAPPPVPTPGAVGSPPRSLPLDLAPSAAARARPLPDPIPAWPGARGAGRRGAPPASRGAEASFFLGEWALGARFWPH